MAKFEEIRKETQGQRTKRLLKFLRSLPMYDTISKEWVPAPTVTERN